MVAVWCTDNAVVLINVVNLHWHRLVMEWVTIRRFKSHLHYLGI